MHVELLPIGADAFHAADGLIITSPRALPSLSNASRSLPLFTTGRKTAQTARGLGFLHVQSGDSDWRELATTITESVWLRPGARLLHVSGERIRGALDTAITDSGMHYARVTGYRMIDCRTLPAAAGQWLEGDDGAALFFSPATSALWYQLASTFENVLRRYSAVCISSACAEALGDLPWMRCEIAAEPTEASVLAALETLS